MNNPTELIWYEFHGRLRAFLARRLHEAVDVEDILQEVFLRVHRTLGTLRSHDRLGPWLFRITRHAIADHYRTVLARPEMPAGLRIGIDASEGYQHSVIEAFARVDAESEQARQELAHCLRPLMDYLSPEYRDVLVMTEWEGTTQRVAAHRLGLSVSGMKSRVQRGRQQLRRMLEECCRLDLDINGRITAYEPRDVACRHCADHDASMQRSTPSTHGATGLSTLGL